MKYFSFNINPLKLLPLAVCGVLLNSIMWYLHLNNRLDHSEATILNSICVVIILLLIPSTFYAKKASIKGFSIGDTPLNFNGDFINYLTSRILLFFGSLISFGLIYPFGQKVATSDIVDNTSINDHKLTFVAKTLELFFAVIRLLYVPMLATKVILDTNSDSSPISIFAMIILLLMLFSLIVYIIRWSIDINYKEYNITLNGNLGKDILYNLIAVTATIVSFGLLFPFMAIWINRYYIRHLVAYKDEVEVVTFFEEYNMLKDGKYLLGQMLLTIITLGIYSPWAINNTFKMLASKTGYIKQ